VVVEDLEEQAYCGYEGGAVTRVGRLLVKKTGEEL
jgi:hypothetical protein